MSKYRVYALIHGQVLPEGEIAACRIEQMSFAEQDERGFSTIKAEFTDEMTRDYRTYVTLLPYVEPLKIKSEYVAIYDIEEREPLAALGGGIRAFEKLCQYLFLANAEDMNRKFEGRFGHGSTYVYQVVKVYKIDPEGNECEVNYQIRNGYVFLPNRPDATEWRHQGTSEFLSEALSFSDEIFKRSLSYLYKSSIGYFAYHSPEKIALDHFKSIEVIVNSLSTKDTFAKRLKDTAILISLSAEEEARISKLWEDRSNGDVAHSKEFGISDRYPNQFPLPSNTRYSGSMPDSIAELVCLKYYRYKKNVYSIEVSYDDDYPEEGYFSIVNWMWESNRLAFYTKKCSKKELKKRTVEKFSQEFKINKKELELKCVSKDHFIIRIMKQV